MNKSRQFGKNLFRFRWEDANLLVYLAAALTFGFYLSAVPVKFALILRMASQPGFGAGTSAFEGRFALRRAEARARGERKHLPWRQAGADLEKYKLAADIARRFVRDAKLEALHARGRIGLADAARTALACGMFRAAGAALGAYLGPGAVRFDVEPDYAGGGCEIALWGIFSIRLGHIIRGALAGAIESLTRRVRNWTGIPLRTS